MLPKGALLFVVDWQCCDINETTFSIRLNAAGLAHLHFHGLLDGSAALAQRS